MTETLDQFLDRIYVNFIIDKVLVYQKEIGKGKAKHWSIEQAQKYTDYLVQNEN